MHDVKTKPMADGRATGASVKWDGGQFCFIATDRGILGCGIFNIGILDEFDMAGALAKGTPSLPLVEPEDLLSARVSMVSVKAREIGITEGMTGEEVLEKLLGRK